MAAMLVLNQSSAASWSDLTSDGGWEKCNAIGRASGEDMVMMFRTGNALDAMPQWSGRVCIYAHCREHLSRACDHVSVVADIDSKGSHVESNTALANVNEW